MTNNSILKKTNKALDRRIKQHVIAKRHTFFAIVQPGFEKTAKRELTEIGVTDFLDNVEGGIEFSARLEYCYKTNLCSRTISRLLIRLTQFKADSFNKLQKKVNEIPWELYIKTASTLSLNIKSKHSKLYHTGRIEEEIQTGIKSRLSQFDIKISFLKSHSHNIQQIFIRFENNKCQISLDTSGELLYRRGLKTHISEASIRETLAAQILYESKINNYDILIDPMCGSGTFSIEGGEIFKNNYPNFDRNFSFKNWPSFKPAAYNHLIKSITANLKKMTTKKLIFTSDINKEAISIAQHNIEKAKLYDIIEIKQLDFFKHKIEFPQNKKHLIVLNPPYGKRLNNTNTEIFYRKIGNTIKNFYPTSGYAIISPSINHEKIMSLPYDRKIIFMNGGIKVAVIIKDAY